MRSLSPKSKDLLERLREPALSLKHLLRIGDSPAIVLDQLGMSGEPLTLVHVLPYVFDKRRSVARAAARAGSRGRFASSGRRTSVWSGPAHGHDSSTFAGMVNETPVQRGQGVGLGPGAI